MRQQRPNDARVFVGQRDRRHILVAPLGQRLDPGARIGLVLRVKDHGPRAVYQQRSQVGIAPLADAQQVLLAATGVWCIYDRLPTV